MPKVFIPCSRHGTEPRWFAFGSAFWPQFSVPEDLHRLVPAQNASQWVSKLSTRLGGWGSGVALLPAVVVVVAVVVVTGAVVVVVVLGGERSVARSQKVVRS